MAGLGRSSRSCPTARSGQLSSSPPLFHPQGLKKPFPFPLPFKSPAATYTAAAQALGPHVAPLGMQFYRRREGAASAFPQSWHRNILVAQHGSWDRDLKIGYRLVKPSGWWPL